LRIGTSPKGMIFGAINSGKQVLRGMGKSIHPTSENKISANFALPEFSEVRIAPVRWVETVGEHNMPPNVIGKLVSLTRRVPP
jgi:hypothetical protein